MKNMKKRILAALLSLSMAVSVLTPAGPIMNVSAAEELVNVALKGTASTDNTSGASTVISNVNDGNDATNWQSKGEWPTTAVVQLDMGRSISKVVVKLGGDDNTARNVDVTVKYAQNNVISDLITLGVKEDVTLSGTSKTVTFDLDQAVSATHIYVILSDPVQNGATGAFWACISEIEVYESQEVALSKYSNIANQSVISVTGNNEHPSEGSANLVDGSTSTLYKFYNAAMSSEQTITLAYDQARSMDAFVIAFENAGTDQYAYTFNYSILAKNAEGTYDTIVANATANRTDNSSQTYKFAEKVYSEIQIVMHSCTTNQGNGWPAIAEFEVYGSQIEVTDAGSIAFKKPVHAASGKSTAANITDGSKNTTWKGDYYPAYVDIDLQENYNLDTVEIYTPESGYSQYSIYTSLNGRDFDKLAEKTTTDSASLETGEVYQANKREARIVRVYLEYNSSQVAPVLNEVRVTGTPSGTAKQETPEIAVKKYSETAYATTPITVDDTYAEVYGIIERRLGTNYKSWFTLEIAESANAYDYFELSTVNGKTHVKGNDGVSLATGINHYLKYYCNVNISQVGDQVTMPATMPTIDGTVHKETKAKVRYSYNYCTLSYSMAFWGEEEWRNELDWLALNGVNVVLDATAQEEVWRRFLGKLGYSHADAKDYIAGPAYYAWAYMANLSGFGGPVHDSWFEDRTEMARKNQHIMRTLGMQPVLQGYSGMVPTDIQNYDSSAPIISQGKWCSFQRPAMLVTTDAKFDEYAALFYACQEEVYGPVSDYYATDPFHEGGNTGGMNSSDIAKEVLTSMLAADKDAIWIIQAWQGNPTTALLNGLDAVTTNSAGEAIEGAQHALVLDLYAEKTPHYNETGNAYGDTVEFDDTPWVFCMLNNFGGRLGLHGHLDNLANNIPAAFNSCDDIAGIGIAPEASVNNPVLYDFLFETIWQDDATQKLSVIDLDTWLDSYATRRYGAASTSANQAWDILKETVYKASLNNLGQGAPESVVNARPALTISAASTWGNAVISYDKLLLEDAAELLLKDYATLKSSKGYMYDVANVLQQVLSNSAQECHKMMTAAYNEKNVENFKAYSEKFLEIIDYMERVTATSEYFLLGRWVEQAKGLADSAVAAGDDFTVELYEMNARALITTWGAYNQAESGGLKDYSNRQWSGLIGDFYKPRWQRWITARTNELEGNSYESSINWFQWEWEWVRSNAKTYTVTPVVEDLSVLGAEILKKYSSENPATDDSRDVDVKTITVTDGNHETSSATQGAADLVQDGLTDTLWHTDWDGSAREEHYIIFNFAEPTVIDGMRFLQRPAGSVNGVITKYDLYVKRAPQSEVAAIAEDGSDEWEVLVDDGVLTTDRTWQMVNLTETEVTAVKFQVVDAMSDKDALFASAAEIRFTTPETVSEETPITPSATKDVEVKAGKTVVFEETGSAPLNADLTKLDTTKATVKVESTYVSDVAAYTYNSTDKTYTNTPIDLSDCLYTFSLNEDGTYTISALAEDGKTTVYLNPRSGNVGFPNRTVSEKIKVEPQTDGGFKFIDMNTDGQGADKCLTYWYRWLVFNEDNSSDSQAVTSFKVYKRVETTDESGNLTYTYNVVNTIENGGQYAIVAEFTKDSAEQKYALRPSASYSTDYDTLLRNDHIVRVSSDTIKVYTNKITITGVSEGETSAIVGTTQYNIKVLPGEQLADVDVTVQLGETVRIFDQSGTFSEAGLADLNTSIANVVVESKTINDLKATARNSTSGSEGAEILLSSCIYSFNKNVDGTYSISGTTADGTTVYLNPYTHGQQGYPNSRAEESILVEKTGDGTFKFTDASEDDYCLTYRYDWGVFNEIETTNTVKVFKLYELKETTEGSGIYEYQDATEVRDGGQYVIVAEYTDDSGNLQKRALCPSSEIVNTNDAVERVYHVAKITDTKESITGNEMLIHGLSLGDTSAVVGTTTYNIHVIEGKQLVYVKVGEKLTLPGTSVTLKPDTAIATMTKNAAEDGYEITGVFAGETIAVVDNIHYHVKVVGTQIGSGIGSSNGLVVKRLTISANNTFNLDIINSEATNITWKIVDKLGKDGKEVGWATVSEDGVVSAKNQSDYQNTYNGFIVATVDGVEYTTELKVTPAPTSENTRLYDVYVDELYHTEVYYGWNYGYSDGNGGVEYGSSGLTECIEGEVIYVSLGSNYSNALDFFAKPEEGYALTQMGSTGSHGHYMRLEGNTPEETEFIYEPGVAGYVQYHDMDEASTTALVQLAMKEKCHGAQGFTRLVNDGSLSTILDYRSEKLPAVKKEVIGISDTSGNYRKYTESMKAQIGDYVFFKVSVDTYPIVGQYYDSKNELIDDHEIIAYKNVKLNDLLEGAVFISEDQVGQLLSTDTGSVPIIDITKDIEDEAQVGQTHEYYVAYQIKAQDVVNIDMTVKNTVELTYDYKSYYSSGTFGGEALDDAEIIITDVLLKHLVIDFGLPAEYVIETEKQFLNQTDVDTKHGKATIVCEKDGNIYKNTITYTPDSILQEPDAIPLTAVEDGAVYVSAVYPATTVYYEEGFAELGNSWGEKASTGAGQQTMQILEKPKAGTAVANYGYDEKYGKETAGPSNGTEAVSTTAGSGAIFTFTGTGVDIYANCQGGDDPTGTISVLVKNSEGLIKKLMIVNTRMAGVENGVTAGQNIDNAYHLPVASIDLGEHDTYHVDIRHTKTQEEKVYEPVLDENGEQKLDKDGNPIYKIVYNVRPVRLDGFKVYNTLEDSSDFEVHNEANPNFLEMRNAVLSAENISKVLGSSIYAEEIAANLKQVYDSVEAGNNVTASAYILMNDANTTDKLEDASAKDLLDNGPKNELFLYPNESLIFGLAEGLENVQIGLKAVSDELTVAEGSTLNAVSIQKTVQETAASAEATVTTEELGLKFLSSSTDMFYRIGDIEKSTESATVKTTITITNNSGKILSVTDLKYFMPPEAKNSPLITLGADDFMPALLGMGYSTKAEETPSVTEVFTDVVDGWYTEYVQYVYDREIMTGIGGTSEFRPNGTVTKAQAAQVLYNMEGCPEVTDFGACTELKDVSEGWYTDAVCWAYSVGVVTGNSSTKEFQPNAYVTREQFAMMLYRYAKYKGCDITQTSDLKDLLNADKVSDWAVDGVKWTVGMEIISGSKTENGFDLAPQSTASRAQMAAILARFCEKVN